MHTNWPRSTVRIFFIHSRVLSTGILNFNADLPNIFYFQVKVELFVLWKISRGSALISSIILNWKIFSADHQRQFLSFHNSLQLFLKMQYIFSSIQLSFESASTFLFVVDFCLNEDPRQNF